MNMEIMKVVDSTLRVSSFAIFVLIIYQLFVSKRGSAIHQITGWTTFGFGILITIVVIIRGIHFYPTVSFAYFVHIVTGLLFFFFLFKAVSLGIKSRRDKKFARAHGRYAWATFWSLIFTIGIGIISFYSHK